MIRHLPKLTKQYPLDIMKADLWNYIEDQIKDIP